MDQADYVVVGAGSAGCIVARRRAETGASVVLVEAGPADRTRLVRKPGMIAVLHNVPQLKRRLDWGYYTVPQENALGRRIPQARGRVLGGSSSVREARPDHAQVTQPHAQDPPPLGGAAGRGSGQVTCRERFDSPIQ